MSGQNWRTEINAQDYLGHQKKRVELEQRRPVVRKASDLVGPGIGSEAVRITDYNDILATFNGYYSSAPGALNAPGDESYVGTTVSDPVLGGRQTFIGLSTGYEYTRTFVRNASDASAISWGVWEATERVPASATSREPVDTTDITAQGSQLLRPPRIDTLGAPGSYARSKSDIYVLRPGVYAGFLHIEGPEQLKLTTISVVLPDRDGSKTLTFGPLKCKMLTPIPFTFWTTGESQEIRVYVSHNDPASQTITWSDFTIVRVGDVPAASLGFEGAVEVGGGSVISDPDPGTPDEPDAGDIRFREDSFTLTTDGAQDLTLIEVPLPGSEHLYWNGLYQRETENWTRALDTKVVSLLGTPVPPGVGDRISVEYAYLQQPYVYVDPSVTPEPVAASAERFSYGSPKTSLALPAGTQVDDLLVVAAVGGFSDGEVTCGDTRMTRAAHWLTDEKGIGRLWGVWVGYASTLDPLSVSLQAEYSPMGQFASTLVMSIRGIEGKLLWDPARVAVGPAYATGTGSMPEVPGTGSGALAVVVGSTYGGLSGYWTSPAMDPYQLVGSDGSSGTFINLGYGVGEEISATVGAPSGQSGTWRGIVIGLK